jgi:thiamine transport system ATP-binding protein
VTLTLDKVAVRFGVTTAVDDVTLEVRDGERLSVLGPSGSGKSTLLRAICGLEPLAAGHISWDGQDLVDVPVHRRGFGLMFQDYLLFPHLDVAGNVGFGLTIAGASQEARRTRVAEVLELVGLRGFETRLTGQLSGGEQQRVALARALAPRPRLLMLDEPLGALDRALRRSLLDELSGLFEQISLPIVYVTHDHEEALAIGDRIAVMHSGLVEAVLPPQQLWQRPPNEFVARFLGLNNILDADVVDGQARTTIGTFTLAGIDASAPAAGPHRLLIRPDAFRPSADGEVQAGVVSTAFRGDYTLLRVSVARGDKAGDNGDTGDTDMTLEVHADWPVPEVGERVRLSVDPSGVVLLPLT